MPDIQTKIAKQKSKGAPRDGGFNDRETPKGASTRSFETAPEGKKSARIVPVGE